MEINDKYKISSSDIEKLYKQMKSGELIYAPFYQRNFVWEQSDQEDFILTILNGYPCPEIFIADGKRNIELGIRYIHVIDGQQRLTSIKNFREDKYKVNGKLYSEMNDDEKIRFQDYEIGLVTLKLDPESDIEEIKEIFRRLNKNKYTLNETEKRISQFSDNKFVLFARLLSGDLIISTPEELDENPKKIFEENPFITEDFKTWALSKDFTVISDFLEKNVYTSAQKNQNYPTKDIIDIIGIFLQKKFFSRILEDEKIIELTEEAYKNRNKIYNYIIKIIDILNEIKPDLSRKAYMTNRGNIFSLIVALMFELDDSTEFSIDKLKENLNGFFDFPPDDYKNAAKNSVMDKKQREIRHKYIQEILNKSI